MIFYQQSATKTSTHACIYTQINTHYSFLSFTMNYRSSWTKMFFSTLVSFLFFLYFHFFTGSQMQWNKGFWYIYIYIYICVYIYIYIYIYNTIRTHLETKRQDITLNITWEVIKSAPSYNKISRYLLCLHENFVMITHPSQYTLLNHKSR